MSKSKSLKELRKSKDLNQSEMAKFLGMSFMNYCNYEKRVYKTMSPELEEKISDMFDIDYKYNKTAKDTTPTEEKTLKQLRQEKGITQVQMSILLNMSYNNYVNYDRGYYNSMPEEVEAKISEILGVEYHYRRRD